MKYLEDPKNCIWLCRLTPPTCIVIFGIFMLFLSRGKNESTKASLRTMKMWKKYNHLLLLKSQNRMLKSFKMAKRERPSKKKTRLSNHSELKLVFNRSKIKAISTS